MLSLEEQIERIADAAFAETSAVEWRDPTGAADSRGHDRRPHRWLLAVAAGVLTIGLVGGLVALVQTDRTDPLAPVDTGPAPASTPPDETTPVTVPITTPTTTPVTTPETTRPSTSSLPQSTAPVVPVSLEPCSADGNCSYASLNDGRLVRLDSWSTPPADGTRTASFENGLPVATIYGDDGATTVSFDVGFAPSGAYLLDVGPGDIAYIGWTKAGEESEFATVSAFELTGSAAGRLVRQFDARLDPTGDSEYVPTRAGFVGLVCCGPDPIRPAPDADVLVPWVDRNGADIVADDRTTFVVTVGASLGVRADRPGDSDDQSWDVFSGGVFPRGMPSLSVLTDGRIVMIVDGMNDDMDDPIYLLPDGDVEQVPSPGQVVHVLPDGRFIVRGLDGTVSLIEM